MFLHDKNIPLYPILYTKLDKNSSDIKKNHISKIWPIAYAPQTTNVKGNNFIISDTGNGQR